MITISIYIESYALDDNKSHCTSQRFALWELLM